MITDYQPLYPYAVLIVLAVLLVLIDTSQIPRKPGLLGALTAGGALIALFLSFRAADSAPWQGLLQFDGYARTFNAIFLLTLAIISIGAMAEERKTAFAGEFYALLICSTIGLLLLSSAGGLLILFLGLELSMICLFPLVGFAKWQQRSAEASLKLLVLGSVASAIFLFGASIIYGVLGTTQFDQMAAAIPASKGPALWLGVAFVLSGLAFKMAAAPFHLWAPDVYEGAPPTIAAFLATASEAAGFAALLRFLLVGLGATEPGEWQVFIVVLAVLSMVIGNLAALSQTNFKRMLAYSGIAQVGYVLVAVSGIAGNEGGMAISATVMYLFLYAFTNIGAFLIAQAVADATGSDEISALRGLHRRSPLLAFATLVAMFSLGGIPPLAGFVGKLYLFAAGWQGGQQALVILGALTSVIALYYYLMVALQVYIRDPEDDRRMEVPRPLGFAIAICVAGTLAIGIFPRPLVSLGEKTAHALYKPAPPVALTRQQKPANGGVEMPSAAPGALVMLSRPPH